MWDLIVSVPDHCLSFYFDGWAIFSPFICFFPGFNISSPSVLMRPQINRKQRTFQRTSMLKAEILPKTPCDMRSNFQRMQRV